MTQPRFNIPRLSHAGEERIRRAMKRGHSGDDPRLPIRRHAVVRDDGRFMTWHGPVDHGSHEEPLWEMEIDLEQFRGKRRGPR